jgi:hypothetical protein
VDNRYGPADMAKKTAAEDVDPEDEVVDDELEEDEPDDLDEEEDGDLDEELDGDEVVADDDDLADDDAEVDEGETVVADAVEEDEDEDEDDEGDVEASLDVILKERLVQVDEEDEEDDEPNDPEDRAAPDAGKVQPRQPQEFVCQSCFLVKHPSQLADAKRQLCRDCV